MRMPQSSRRLATFLLFVGPLALPAQEPILRCDPPARSLAHLSHSQKQEFMKSQELLSAGRYTEALDKLRALLDDIPDDTPEQYTITERTAEAALEAGERSYAIELLKPFETSSGYDCTALSLLARAYAELRHDKERDAAIAALIALHTKDSLSPAGKLDGFIVEQQHLRNGATVRIWHMLKPFGPHNTQLIAQVRDAQDALLLSIELDSDDADQVYFRRTHPDLAAKGARRYSLDAFMTDNSDPSGQPRTTRSLIHTYDGFPPYNTVRDSILAIANRTSVLTQQ